MWFGGQLQIHMIMEYSRHVFNSWTVPWKPAVTREHFWKKSACVLHEFLCRELSFVLVFAGKKCLRFKSMLGSYCICRASPCQNVNVFAPKTGVTKLLKSVGWTNLINLLKKPKPNKHLLSPKKTPNQQKKTPNPNFKVWAETSELRDLCQNPTF